MKQYRVTGNVRFIVPAKAPDAVIGQAAIDARKWRDRFDNDAEIGSGYGYVLRSEKGDEVLSLSLHINDHPASSLAAAMTFGMTTLADRCAQVGRNMADAVAIDVDAAIQKAEAAA